MRRFFSRTAPILAVLLSVVILGAADVSRQQADVFARKLDEMVKPNPPAIRPGLRRTAVTDGELNSWLTYGGQPLLPSGVTEPAFSFLPEGRLTAQAFVDLDRVAAQRSSGGLLDPWRYIGGRVPVKLTGILRTGDGSGRFDLEAAELSGIPIPKTLLQEIVSFYSRSGSSQGVRLDDAFALPAGIQSIELTTGRAVVVQ